MGRVDVFPQLLPIRILGLPRLLSLLYCKASLAFLYGEKDRYLVRDYPGGGVILGGFLCNSIGCFVPWNPCVGGDLTNLYLKTPLDEGLMTG